MKVIAAIEADPDRSPIGTVSRLGDDLAGCAVLRRTVTRLTRCRRIDSIHVITSSAQRDRIAGLVNGLGAIVETHTHGPPPWQDRVRRTRKWSLECWRGGIAGLCCFDEYLHAGVLGALGQRERADAVAAVPAAAPLVDPALLDAMIEHLGGLEHDTRIVFSQAPPGLAGVLAQPGFYDDVFRAGHPPGAVLAYIPANPQLDFTAKPCCYSVPGVVVETPARVLADTHRGMALLTELLAQDDETALTAERICRFVADRRADQLDRLPREVEIELTTDDQLGETTLRPRGRRVPARGPIPVDLVRKIADELTEFDDALLVLGGFGEPLLHPELPDVVAACRQAGIFGLAVRTNGLALTGDVLDVLIDQDVDVVNVTLDAHSAETYRALNQSDAFDQVVGNIEAMQARIVERGRGGPLIVPEMAKLRGTLPEQEGFYDDWIRRTGWANIVTPSHYAGQLPDQAIMSMAPPRRARCARLWSRLIILADGTAVTCDQDFAARQPVGRVDSGSIASIWTGEGLAAIRAAHSGDSLGSLPLCPACDEWHRP